MSSFIFFVDGSAKKVFLNASSNFALSGLADCYPKLKPVSVFLKLLSLGDVYSSFFANFGYRTPCLIILAFIKIYFLLK